MGTCAIDGVNKKVSMLGFCILVRLGGGWVTVGKMRNRVGICLDRLDQAPAEGKRFEGKRRISDV